MSVHQNLGITIKVAPKTLVEALEKNKAKHLEDFDKAKTVFFKEVEEELKKLYKNAKENPTLKTVSYRKDPPVNNEKLYDKYIGMFKVSTDDTILISSEDYGCIFDDSWGWAVAANASNSLYSSKYKG